MVLSVPRTVLDWCFGVAMPTPPLVPSSDLRLRLAAVAPSLYPNPLKNFLTPRTFFFARCNSASPIAAHGVESSPS